MFSIFSRLKGSAVQISQDEGLAAFEASLRAAPPGVFDVDAMMSDAGLGIEGIVLSSSGDFEGAFQLWNGGFRSQIHFVFMGPLGEAAWRTDRFRDAIRSFEGVSRDATERSRAKFRLGQAYEAVGERDNALAAYRTFLSRMENADPGLTWVEDAREAVERLSG